MYELLKLHFYLFRNFLRNVKKEDIVRFCILFTIFFLLISFGGFLSAKGFSFVQKLPALGEILNNGLIQLLFFVLFHFLILSSLIVGYGTLFRSNRLPFLFSIPIPAEKIFIIQVLKSILQSSWASFILLGAVLVSYGISRGLDLSYFLALPVVLFLFLSLCGAIGVTLAFVLAVLRNRLGKRIFVFAGAVVFLLGLFYLGGQLKNLPLKEGEELIFFTNLTEGLRSVHSPFWPGKWAANAVLSFSRRYISEGLFATGLLASSVAVFWPILDLAGRTMYLRIWQQLAGGGRQRKKGRRPETSSAPLASIIRKDLLLFRRDPTQSLQLMLFLLLMGLYTVSLMRFPDDDLPKNYFLYISLSNLMAIAFILASFSSRFVYPVLGIEGKAIWILANSPVRPVRLLFAKLVFGLLLLTPAGTALAVTSQLELVVPPGRLAAGTILIVLLSIALATLALGFSAAFTRFVSDRPGEVLGTTGGTANFFASSGLVCIVIGTWSIGTILGTDSAAGILLQIASFLVPLCIIPASFHWAVRSFREREY